MVLRCVECDAEFVPPCRPGARPLCCSEQCRVARRKELAARRHVEAKGHELTARAAVNSRRNYERLLADPEAMRRQREMTAAWRRANTVQVAAYEARYRQENAARITEKNRRRRARLLDAWVEDVNLALLLERTGGACGICQEPIDLELAWPHKMSVTVDHVKPLSKGGVHSYANTQPAHAVCDLRKNNREIAA